MEHETVEVSVVFPCLNEEGTIGLCVRAARTALESAGMAAEVLVADNGSEDASREVARQQGARVVDVRHLGYGNALRTGLRQAQGQYLIFLDSDMSYDCADIPRFVEELRKGPDLVIGSRVRGGIDPGAMPWSHRFLGTPVLTALANLFFGCGISDINCGMRGLTRDAFKRLDLHAEGMEFASEMMIKAAREKLRIAEIPIVFHMDQRGRSPHLRSFRDGWRHLQLMMHYWSMWIFFLPAVLFVLAGFFAILAAPHALPSLLASSLTGIFSVTFGVLISLLGVTAQGHVHGPKYAKTGSTPLLRFLRTWFRVETGVALGLLVLFVGLLCIAGAILLAYRAAPGSQFLAAKAAFLGAAVFISGLDVAFASLFLGLFGIRVAEDDWIDPLPPDAKRAGHVD